MIFSCAVNLSFILSSILLPIINSTQLEQGSVAVSTGRHVLMSEGQGSCDVMEALGREVVVRYLSTLQNLELRPLVTELRILKAKAEVSLCLKTP